MIDVTEHGPDGHWDYGDIKRLCKYRDDLLLELSEANRLLAEARRDAERYRWLKRTRSTGEWAMRFDSILDDYIDAALAQPPKQEKEG